MKKVKRYLNNKTMLVSLFSLISNIKVISNYSYLMKLLMIWYTKHTFLFNNLSYLTKHFNITFVISVILGIIYIIIIIY